MNNINDIVLHTLVVRIAYKDNSTEEFRAILSNEYEIDIPQNKLDELTAIPIGPKIQQFVDWLTGLKISQTTEKIIITSTNYQITDKYTTVICKNQVSITLPDTIKGSRCSIKNATDDKNVTIIGIVDQQQNPIALPREAYSLICDGVEWHII